MPKVSVIIPAYNSMTYLPETLQSLLAQTYSDFEAIIINDGSTDHTQEWVSQQTDPRIKLISQVNKGLSGARNTGIEAATGEYLAFLDADDLWHPTKLQKQVECLDNNPDVGLVYSWVALINEHGIPTGRLFKNSQEGNVWEHLILQNIVESGSGAMVRRQCFETCGVFDVNLRSFVEDWDMWLRIALHYPFKAISEPLVYYRQHSQSASRNWAAMEQSYSLVIEKAFAAAPSRYQHLKGCSYARTHLCLAWKPLQSVQKDYKKALDFATQAVTHDPKVRWEREYLRLRIAIALMAGLGPENYNKFLRFFHTLRRRVKLQLN
ncbi:glycosyltransferase family 2 protein [Laspinema olomoucense]|uniref:glycosyltransferase family 2 protein n=1 Tax=Laspinema olomoucense TaxID=3231600 RepID=UPI0021BAB208|nr:glycosyltransferase [Laspinema sp. D3c]MCT7995763.1 glycosyltransferase [Laspinema sp. D3c]